MKSAHRLGIDFGTTRTVVALADRGNYPVATFTVPGDGALEWYPSLVAERSGELVFGLDALSVADELGWTTLRSMKRLLAQPSVRVGGLELTRSELLVRYLEALRRDLLERSNLAPILSDGGALEAVVAVPAAAHSTQRFLTLDAFGRAGFEVAGLLNEPAAAGLEYAHRHARTITAKREQVLVYDLGGGTFDAALVDMSGKRHEVLAARGLAKLGGDDFDATLATLALAKAGLPASAVSAAARAQLEALCCQEKERLHAKSRRVTLDLSSIAEGAGAVTVDVADYYEACAPLVAKTLDLVGEVAPADDTLAGLYVVGGASALGVVSRMLKDRYGRRVHRSPYPSSAIAIGLAIAGDEAGFALSDRFSRTFGVFREAEAGLEVAFDPLLTPELTLPQGDARLTLERTYRAAHNIGHFRFIECSALGASSQPTGDITPFAEVLFPYEPSLQAGALDLREVPVSRRGGRGPLVRERYAIDPSGIVELTITDLDTGYERQHRLGA